MPRQTITYDTKEIAELIKTLLEMQGRKVIGDVKMDISATSDDGGYHYSPAAVTATAQIEDGPQFQKRPSVELYPYDSCPACGGRGAGYCSSCGNPGSPGDR